MDANAWQDNMKSAGENMSKENAKHADGYVFISYKSEEKDSADWLKRYLEKNGYRCWMAPDSLHLRGTQDYGKDILQAIRGCRCLLFAMSPRALGSWWVNQEVKTAMTKYHRPIVPFMVSPIPEALKEDSLYTFIENDKQILNAESAGEAKEQWRMDVLLPYLESAFGEHEESWEDTETVAGGESATTRVDLPSATQTEWTRWRSLASFHLGRLKDFKAIELLDTSPTVLSLEARSREGRESATAAALALMRILGTKAEAEPGGDPAGITAEAKQDLAELVYEYGDDFSEEVWNIAEPYAEKGVPWAAFVMHVRHYSPDGRGELKESDQALVRRYLETAVKDSGNAFAAIRMGICWHFGVGGEVSGTRALYWYQTAGEANCTRAWYWLGRLYWGGVYGVRPDWTKAQQFAKRGVEAGDISCHALLGDILLSRLDSTGSEAVDYGAVEKEYAEAWRGGEHDVLPDVFSLKNDYKWKLCQPEFQKLDLLLERAFRSELGVVWQILYKCAEYWNWGRKHLIATEEGEEEAEVSEAAIQYALAGSRQNDRFSEAMLGEAIVLEAVDEAGALDVSPIVGWVEDIPELRSAPECKKYLDVMQGQTFEPEKGFISRISRFWDRLFDSGKSPSELSAESEYSTFQFLQYLKGVKAEAGGKLDCVRRLWKGFGLLEQGICAKEAERKNWAEVFPEDSFRFEGDALDDAIRTLRDIPDAFPARADQLRGPIDRAVNDLKMPGDRCGSLLNKEVQEDFRSIQQLLIEYATQNTPVLRVARTLASLERRLSPPMLAAPLRLFRNAYLQHSHPGDAVALGTLFFTMNARYREEGKNAGLLFAAREMLWKAIHQMDASAVLPFLEVCLFGRECSGAELPEDFDAINQAEPVIREIVETKANSKLTEWEKYQCLQIAYAMASIFLDENLRRNHGKAGWGTTHLYNIQKGIKWLAVVLELRKMKDWGDLMPWLEAYVEQKAKKVEKEGYVILHDVWQEVSLQTQLEKYEGGAAETKWASEGTIDELFAQLNRMELKGGRGFRHVRLEDGYDADFVVANDDFAVVFAVLPAGTDYRALPVEEGKADGGEPKSTHDCVVGKDGVTIALLDCLMAFQHALVQKIKDPLVMVGILASEATGESMRKVWGERLEEANVLVETTESFSDVEVLFEDDKKTTDGGGQGNGRGEVCENETKKETMNSDFARDTEDAINELAGFFAKVEYDPTWAHPHVELGGRTADFVLSDGALALVYAVLPGNTNFRALADWEDSGGVPLATRDCIQDGNCVSITLLDSLLAFKEVLAEKEPDLKIRLHIYASTQTGMSMKDVWADRMEEAQIHVESKEELEAWVEKVLRDRKEADDTGEVCGEDNGGDAGEG